LNHEFAPLRIAPLDLEKDETVRHSAESHFVVERFAGIISVEVFLLDGAITAVERIQPSFKRMAYRGVRDGGLLGANGSNPDKQGEQQRDADALRHGITSRVVKLWSLTSELEIQFPEKYVIWSVKSKTQTEDRRQ